MKKKVLVASFYNREAVAPVLEQFSKEVEILLTGNLGRSFTKAEILARLDGIDAVIAAEEPYDRDVFRNAPRLAMVARDGVGFDKIDLEAATGCGVVVTNAPVIHETVADLSFGLMIAAVRKIPLCDRGARQGRWTDRDLFLSSDVNGKTLGIIGFGRVGKAMARRAKGFGLEVIAYDPFLTEKTIAEEPGVRLVGFTELLSASDIITIHVPLTPETRGIIDAKAISGMKNGVFLVNASRGEIIEEEAMISALKTGKIAGAGLDVIREEPPSAGNPLLLMDNVVITPHVGSDTFDTFRKVYECNFKDILLFFNGRRPGHVLNPDVFRHNRLQTGEQKTR